MAGPLEGLKIIEIEGLGPCPLAGQLMADLGADVIVICRKSGKPNPADINNRSKRSLALNLKSERGKEALHRLLEKSDILIEGMRPGAMERLGLGPQECHARNPALIYGRMTGWGQTGPMAFQAGHDINYLALTGALSMMGKRGEPPDPPLNLVADYGGGAMFLLLGILSALYERQTSNKGQTIDASMVDGVAAMMGLFHNWKACGQWGNARGDNLLDGGAPFYRCYETADGKYLSVGALEPQFFAEFLRLAGLDASHAVDQYDKSNWAGRAIKYTAHFKQKTCNEWMASFDGSDACVAPVLSMDEAPLHPHNIARNTFSTLSGILQASPAPKFDRSASNPVGTTPAPGENSIKILADLGFSTEEISDLKDNGDIT